jgi:hypothetical protein
MTSETGTVVACSLDRPDAATSRVLSGEPTRLSVSARRGRDLPLRHNRARRRNHNREHMLVPVRVDTNDIIHLICKHHY